MGIYFTQRCAYTEVMRCLIGDLNNPRLSRADIEGRYEIDLDRLRELVNNKRRDEVEKGKTSDFSWWWK